MKEVNIMSTSFIFGADIVPTPSNYEIFSNAEIDKLIDKKLKDMLFSADYRVFNLELALTDSANPIVKCGPNLLAPTTTVNGLKEFKPSLFTLANNHTRDHSVEGLLTTMDVLDKNGIAHIGAGKTLDEAKKPYIFEKDNKKIAVLACAEHEFTIVDEELAGANPFDPYETLDEIAELKKANDFVVVLYHGGKEHYRYPSPKLQKRCRKMLSKGADLVICQHTHCVGCFEEYAGGTVVYGQGNFLFDYLNSEYWATGLLVRAEITDKLEISYIPFCKDGVGIRAANDEEAKEILDGFYARSEEIKQDGFIKENYLKIAQAQLPDYMYYFAGGGSRKLEKTKDFGLDYLPTEMAAIFNLLNCEVHRETIMAATWDIVQKADKKRRAEMEE